MNRKWKRRIRIDPLKGLAVRILGRALGWNRFVPRPAYVLFLAGASWILKIAWFLPFLPWRRSARNMLRLGARGESPRRIFYRLVDGVRFTALAFLDVHRLGVEAVLPRIRFTPRAKASFDKVQEEGGRAVVVLPHVLGGILSAALVTKRYPTVILSRGPRSEKRAELQRDLMKPLELNLIVLDRTSAVKAARQFLRALKDGNIIVGTTDLIYKREDSVPAVFFGQDVHLPSWPARFGGQARAPIFPGFVRILDGVAEIDLADPIREKDLEKATQAWADAFQAFLLDAPWDWAFLCDLRWGRLLDGACRKK